MPEGQQLSFDSSGITIRRRFEQVLVDIPGNRDIFFIRSLDSLFQDLIKLVFDNNLKQGIANSLDAKLDLALRVLEDMNENNNVAAINALQGFINEVERQRGLNISEADALIAATQQIRALLGGREFQGPVQQT